VGAHGGAQLWPGAMGSQFGFDAVEVLELAQQPAAGARSLFEGVVARIEAPPRACWRATRRTSSANAESARTAAKSSRQSCRPPRSSAESTVARVVRGAWPE